MKPENMKLENVYLNGEIDRVEICFCLPITCGIYISNIISLSIFIDGQEIDSCNIWLKKGNFETPYHHLSLLNYEYIDPEDTISIIFKDRKALSQGCHKVEIQTSYLEYSESCENKYRQINKYQPFSCVVNNRYLYSYNWQIMNYIADLT